MASIIGGAVYELLSEYIDLPIKVNMRLIITSQSGKQKIQTRKTVSTSLPSPERAIMAYETETEPEAGQKEKYSSWALFILIMLLIIALFASYMLQHKKIQVVHETVLSIFAGWHLHPGNPVLTRLLTDGRNGCWSGHTVDRRHVHSGHGQL